MGGGGGGGRGVYAQFFNNFNYFDKDKKCVVFYSTLFYLIFDYLLSLVIAFCLQTTVNCLLF